MFGYLRAIQDEAMYSTAMNTSTDGKFKAVVLSGIRTEKNDGSGPDEYDGIMEGKFLSVVVKPLAAHASSLPDPTSTVDAVGAKMVIGLYADCFKARSDYEYKGLVPVSFGQVVSCYYEKGSISNSDFKGLRFERPATIDIHPDYVRLGARDQAQTAQGAFSAGSASQLGFMPPSDDDIYTRAQRLRESGVDIRGRATPTAEPGDEELANTIGIDVNILRAFRLIESGRYGPSAIRFEPHLYLRKTGQIPPAGCTLGDKAYSEVASETNKSAFIAAYNVNQDAAVKSTSFGLYQVLGAHGIAFYNGAAAFWTAFQADAAKASKNMVVAWFKATPMAAAAANALNFTRLAELYNGPRQAEHYYDALIAEAYVMSLQAHGLGATNEQLGESAPAYAESEQPESEETNESDLSDESEIAGESPIAPPTIEELVQKYEGQTTFVSGDKVLTGEYLVNDGKMYFQYEVESGSWYVPNTTEKVRVWS